MVLFQNGPKSLENMGKCKRGELGQKTVLFEKGQKTYKTGGKMGKVHF